MRDRAEKWRKRGDRKDRKEEIEKVGKYEYQGKEIRPRSRQGEGRGKKGVERKGERNAERRKPNTK